jgi:hypothetical protein
MANRTILKVYQALLEQASKPDEEILNDLANNDRMDEKDVARGEWNPLIDDKVKIRNVEDNETDIDSNPIEVGRHGTIMKHLVAYLVEFEDGEERWVTKTMIEPV